MFARSLPLTLPLTRAPWRMEDAPSGRRAPARTERAPRKRGEGRLALLAGRGLG